jgi:RNA polymerase sigma-70 factor (ECF subfamily)
LTDKGPAVPTSFPMLDSPRPAASSPPVDEARLLAGLRAGDDAAFETLVRAYGGRLLRVAERFLRNEDDARDAVQDAFLSAHRSLDGFQGSSQLSTWLHRITVNAALMKLRARRRKPEDSIDDLLPKFDDDEGHRLNVGPPWRESAEVALQRRQTRQLVRDCIDRLPDGYRTVLLLRDIEDLNTEETARLLDLSPNAVKVRLHRARQALRTLLDPHFTGETQ